MLELLWYLMYLHTTYEGSSVGRLSLLKPKVNQFLFVVDMYDMFLYMFSKTWFLVFIINSRISYFSYKYFIPTWAEFGSWPKRHILLEPQEQNRHSNAEGLPARDWSPFIRKGVTTLKNMSVRHFLPPCPCPKWARSTQVLLQDQYRTPCVACKLILPE